jgi:DNA-binding CsgD family transcriptional regulator
MSARKRLPGPPGLFNPLKLTVRQLQIVDALVRLGQNKLICLELGVRPSSVSIAIGRACKKAGVHGAVLLAVEWTKLRIEHERAGVRA